MAAKDVSSEPSENGGLTGEFVAEWRNAAYSCFSSGHKFCREVCPVTQVTRDEAHTPTAFHANVVAMEKGHLEIEDVARDYVHCTMCGASSCAAPTRSLQATSTATGHGRSISSRRCARWRSRAMSTSRSGSAGTT